MGSASTNTIMGIFLKATTSKIRSEEKVVTTSMKVGFYSLNSILILPRSPKSS